jgi:HPt (histidine-containing phosphotransfer) domain-containing protein
MSHQFIDLEYMDLMCEEDISMKKMMLEMLLDEIPGELTKMRLCLNTADWKDLNAVSHKFKSTLAFIGNTEMTNANKQIEQATKQLVALENIPDWLQILEDTGISVIKELKNEIEKY